MPYNPENYSNHSSYNEWSEQFCSLGSHSLSLAATNEILDLVSFPLGTEMFHFPRFAPHEITKSELLQFSNGISAIKIVFVIRPYYLTG